MPVFVGSAHQVLFNSEGERIEKITNNHINLVLRRRLGPAKQCRPSAT